MSISCSHLKETCSEINWYELGRQDSTKGLTKEKSFAKRQKMCLIKSESIYAKAYENGFLFGLTSYCNFKTGYIYSLSQMEKEVSACPDNLKVKYLRGYEIGTHMKQIQSLQNEIQQKIQIINKKLKNHEEHFSIVESSY
ncbi:MAG: DUF2799 domain-containing protein [Bdellovibrionales bacterium]|nr:DUF2799 domain-containing protein [Bdellovibrionales bacterium]